MRLAIGELAAREGASEQVLERVRLAVSEAASNVVVHAYQEAANAGPLHLLASVIDGELTVVIEDDGRGLRADRHSRSLGVGLMLMAQESDTLAVSERANGGLRVEMTFRLASRHGAGTPDGSVEQRERLAQERGSLAAATAPAGPRFSTTM